MASITCQACNETMDYDDDGVTFDCMPDGVMVGDGKWVCGDCMVDDNGETLPEFS